MDLSKDEIPQGGSPIPAPEGQARTANADDIAQHVKNVTPEQLVPNPFMR